MITWKSSARKQLQHVRMPPTCCTCLFAAQALGGISVAWHQRLGRRRGPNPCNRSQGGRQSKRTGQLKFLEIYLQLSTEKRHWKVQLQLTFVRENFKPDWIGSLTANAWAILWKIPRFKAEFRVRKSWEGWELSVDHVGHTSLRMLKDGNLSFKIISREYLWGGSEEWWHESM